jgi:hypothetical protein
MTSPTEITVTQLSRLIGLPGAPAIIDARIDEDFALDPRLIPGSRRRGHQDIDRWAACYAAGKVVVVCHRGQKLSQGVAALLRHEGIAIDRVACPWLIRRFVDPDAAFLFVSPAEVERVADRFGAVPFDVEDVFWSHRGEACSFDTMLSEFGLRSEAFSRLAAIVRGADTARPDLAPEAAGLLAASLGLSRMYRDDLELLSASMMLYDALYRWCRDATEETHGWPPPKSASGA